MVRAKLEADARFNDGWFMVHLMMRGAAVYNNFLVVLLLGIGIEQALIGRLRNANGRWDFWVRAIRV